MSHTRNFRVLFLYPNMMMNHLVPSGIAVLSAQLKQHGFDTAVFDTTYYRTESDSSDDRKVERVQVRPFDPGEVGIRFKETRPADDLRKLVWEYRPDLVAMSSVEDTWGQGVQLLRHIQDYLKERRIPTVAGGVFPTYAPEVAIQEETVDMVCRGEGDEVLPELCHKLQEREDFTSIQNLWVKVRGTGEPSYRVVRNPMREPVDMDSLPAPDFGIFDRSRLYRPMAGSMYLMAPIETHRGCPYKCTFCNSPEMMRVYRAETRRRFLRLRSPEKTIEEIKYLKRLWNLEYVYFNADTFLAMSDLELQTLSELYRTEIGLPFWMQTRPETFTPTRIMRLQHMGIHRCNVGIEHGNETFRRDVIQRNYSNEVVVNVFKRLESARIPVTVNNIIGFPGETRALALDTVGLNRHLASDTVNCYAFVPYHGTPLRELCIRKGYIREDAGVGGGGITQGGGMDMPQFSHREIQGLLRTFVLHVKFGEERTGEIARAEQFDDAGNAIFQKLRAEFLERFLSDSIRHAA